jgi:hypothetical protein
MELEVYRYKKSDQTRQRLAALSKSSYEPMCKGKRIVPCVSSLDKERRAMLHKIFSSTRNPHSHNSAVLHMTEIAGSKEQANRVMDALEEDGHHVNGWIEEEETEEEYEDRLAQEAQPWPLGKKHQHRWGRA